MEGSAKLKGGEIMNEFKIFLKNNTDAIEEITRRNWDDCINGEWDDGDGMTEEEMEEWMLRSKREE